MRKKRQYSERPFLVFIFVNVFIVDEGGGKGGGSVGPPLNPSSKSLA